MDASAAARPMRASRGSTARAFAGDARLAMAASNQLRLLALRRAFGIDRSEANLLTFVLALTAADASLRTARRVSHAVVPGRGDMLLGGFLAREAALGVAGPAAREFPFVASLLAGAMLAGVALPELRRAVLALRTAEHRVREQRIRVYEARRAARGSSG
jgi:hypothetical protein